MIDEKIYYFAYGSNMLFKRLNDRITARKIGKAKLPNHKLTFYKRSNDNSGKCDIYDTRDSNDYVLGIIYEINKNEQEKLNRIEGKGNGYELKEIEVINENNEIIRTISYFATNIDENLKPYCWYKKHVLEGAKENHLEDDYIKTIEKIPCKIDLDEKRKNRELSIYR